MGAKNLFLFFAIASLSQMVFAQDRDAEAVTNETIVVTGESLSSADAIREGVDRVSPASDPTDPMGRFIDPICLSFAGLNDEQEANFRTIIEFRGENAGARFAAKGCRTNALVVIVDDLKAFVADIRKKQPRLMSVADYRRFESAMKRNDPVFAWNAQEVRTALGRAAPHSASIPGLTLPMSVSTKVNTDARARRVGLEQSAALVNSVIIFDATQIDGLTLLQLADYAAMRLLAPSRIAADWQTGGPASILKLFSTNKVHAQNAMTAFDQSYLLALYDLPLNASPTGLKAAVVKAYFGEVAK